MWKLRILYQHERGKWRQTRFDGSKDDKRRDAAAITDARYLYTLHTYIELKQKALLAIQS
jgi:hypothetical protein